MCVGGVGEKPTNPKKKQPCQVTLLFCLLGRGGSTPLVQMLPGSPAAAGPDVHARTDKRHCVWLESGQSDNCSAATGLPNLPGPVPRWLRR